MIKNIILLFFFHVFLMPVKADELSEYRKVTLAEKTIFLTSPDLSVVTMKDDSTGLVINCKITNFTQNDIDNGKGVIVLTNDKKAIIFRSSKRYMIMDDLIGCKGGKLTLHESPDPKSQYNMLVDINFNKKLYLSLSVFDVRYNEYEAIVAYFGSSENLIKAPGFFDVLKDGKGFYFPGYGGVSAISFDGRYVAPNGINGQCYDIKNSSYGDVFPGVWDIEKRKRVAFKTKLNDMGELANEEEIEKKCADLFKGKNTLEELGGELK